MTSPLQGMPSLTPSHAGEPAPLKILHIIDDLGLGGAQRQLVELVKNSPRSRVLSEVISLSVAKNDYENTLREAGVPLTRIAQSGKWSWPAFFQLRREIAASKPDLVQTWLFTADLYGRLAARLAGIRTVVSTIRSIDADKPRHYVWADRVLKYFTSAFIVNAKANGEVYTRREGIRASSIHTIYNGLDLRIFRLGNGDGGFRSQNRIPSSVFLFGIVGRLQPVKDHETFIRAAALVTKKHSSVWFAIVGSGPLKEKLERLAVELCVEGRIRFIPSQADVARIFSAFDAAVVCSTYEGCSNVILEAMAMAKPVIATDVGGNPELVVQGATGLLVPVGDTQALSAAMETLLTSSEIASEMGLAARRVIEERFSIDRMVSLTLGLYEKLCASSGTRRGSNAS